MAGLGTGGSPLSPGVYSIETDLSIVVPRSTASIGAFAGNFTKGPAGDYRLITNSVELEEVFGAPTNENFCDWLNCKMYLDKADKLYISRAVDENGTWQRSDVLIATAINEPAVGAPAINTVDIAYSETDLIDGSWLRFVQDGLQQRYQVTNFNETAAPVFQKDEVDFGSVTFPLVGGEVFEVEIDGTVISYTGIAGDDVDTVIAALDADFATAGINSVDFLADYTNDKIIVTALEGGLDGLYTIAIGAGDTAGTTLTSIDAAANGLATLTLDMEIVWDMIPGVPGSKQIVTGAGQLDYVFSIATNALTEVKVDTGNFTSQVSEIQIDSGTYTIGDTFTIEIQEAGSTTVNETAVYTVQDDGTGSPENRAAVIDGLYAAVITENPVTINCTKDNVIGKITLTAKYPGTVYSFGVTSTFNDVDASGDTVTFVTTTTPATDGTTPVTNAELFATRAIYHNKDIFDLNEPSIAFSTIDSKLKFIARWVGDTGNDIDIVIAKGGANSDFNQSKPEDIVVDVTSNGVRTVTTTKVSPILALEGLPLDDLFDYEPNTDEIAVIVSVKGEIKEQYIVSLDPTAKDYNNKSKYIEDVINLKSSYVYVKDNTEVVGAPESSVQQLTETTVEQYQVSTGQKIGKSVTQVTVGGPLGLVHGDSGVIRRDDLEKAYDVFSSKEEIEVDILIANEQVPKYVIELAETRGDCIAFVGALYEHTVGLKTTKIIDNMVDYVMSVFGDLNVESSYGAFFGNYIYVYDKWNDKNRWINVAGAAAGLRAETNTDQQAWWASAGLLRGQIAGVDKLAFIPNQGHRDILYKNKINPIAAFPGSGNAVVWGNKTMLSRPSAFDRINVRGLFNALKRSIGKMALNYVFELNDEFTRKRFVESITPYLEWVKFNRGVYDFYIQCNEQNNTPAVIDANQFVATIAVKPARIAEFVILNFVSVGTSVDFEEIFSS